MAKKTLKLVDPTDPGEDLNEQGEPNRLPHRARLGYVRVR